jgi:hypothetical protein
MRAAGFNLLLPWEQILDGATKSTPPDSETILRPGGFSEEAIGDLRDWAIRCRKSDQMMVEVRKVNPGFVFGFYPYAPFWYYDGLARGGGTSKLPCLVFPRAGYDGRSITDAPYTFFGDAPTPASRSCTTACLVHASCSVII